MNLRPAELLILAVVVMLLFGFKRLPDASRSIGRSLRIFKAETKGLLDDDVTSAADGTTSPSGNVPSALPPRSGTLEEQRLQAQRFLDATAPRAAAEPPRHAGAESPTQP